KPLRHALSGRTHAAFRHQLPVVTHHAVAAGLVAQVQSDRGRPCVPGCRPLRTLGSGAILFHGRSPFLHFECVSIGSLSHPAGDRPSHSISVSALSITVSCRVATSESGSAPSYTRRW